MKGLMSATVTGVPFVLLFSKAHSFFAASIWRRLLMQALAWEVARAYTKLGMAMASIIGTKKTDIPMLT